MASFRTGFKIFGEISLKQGLGRIRSFSEDKKPHQWLPEDQWAVRQPGSTCPDLCAKKKKPPKPSKSWLSLCSDPDAPKDPECDVRHNNCPPPPSKDSSPWYSLGKLIPKKKPAEKTPPRNTCCEEKLRREAAGEEEEVGPNNACLVQLKEPPPCIPKECSPAPVANLSCPPPKEINLMLWCDCGKNESCEIPTECQSDRLPYEEFRPQKIWKAPPFSLPCKFEPNFSFPRCCSSCIPYSEFKYIDVPKPLYTRYKSVELGVSHSLFNMIDVQCPENGDFVMGVPSNTPPPPPPLPFSPEPSKQEKEQPCPEKQLIETTSCKPVKLKKATKFPYTPKPTKLIERRVFKDRFGKVKYDLPFRTPTIDAGSKSEEAKNKESALSKSSSPPKVIPNTTNKEPHVYEGILPPSKPPTWMYALCKPGSNVSPLVPAPKENAKEPCDWSSETDGLKFYDGNDENITPKPPPSPADCKEKKKSEATPPPASTSPPPAPVNAQLAQPDCDKSKKRFVLMPEKYNIKLMRKKEPSTNEAEPATVEKIIAKKATPTQKCPSAYPTIKEHILYDLQRICPQPPMDPSKLNSPCRKPPAPVCPRPPRFYRSLSTLAPSTLTKLCSVEFCKIPKRTECGDTSGKCKARDLNPKPSPCPDPCPGPDCAEIALPCCPKAKVPPNCNVKKTMPCCKKKLAPKPSFSECSKDPPMCPRPTECNCWTKVPKK